jgi:hypothetical protein
MASNFSFIVDVSKVAETLGRTRDVIETKVTKAVEGLSISTHAFIINKANHELGDFKRKYFLGLGEYGKKTTKESTKDPRVDQTARNVRWTLVTGGIWVVEIDDSVKWIEEGRPPTSMATEDWLLKPGKVKHSKDGNTYRSIPFKITENGKPASKYVKPVYPTIVKHAMKAQGITSRIERHPDGTPKLGVLHKLNINVPEGGWMAHPAVHSKPRSEEMAMQIGLKPHGGIYHLEGAVVTQRLKVKRGKRHGTHTDISFKPVKETVVFRTVSSKHRMEGRWMAPEVKPFGAIPAAYAYAQQQWEKIVRDLQEEIDQVSRGG